MSYRYCPFERKELVINKPPSHAAWVNFTVFQQSLWMIDEIEARWQRLITMYPNLEYEELYWSKSVPDSFNEAATSIASFLGMTEKIVYKLKKHMKVHVGGDEHDEVIDFLKEDNDYRRKMKYDNLPP
jgi:hypothetical protein